MLGAYAAAAFFFLAPLFDHPTTAAIETSSVASWLQTWNTDQFIWTLAWDWHSLLTQPSSFWNANILFPTEGSLAAVFPMLGHLPIFGLLSAWSDSSLVAHQLTLLANFTFSGAALYALLRHWHIHPAAALLAGFVYALCPARVGAIATPSLVAGQYLPLGILFLDRATTRRHVGDALWAALFLAWQAICAPVYALVVPVLAALFWMLAVLRRTPGHARLLIATMIATGVAAATVLPLETAVESGALQPPEHLTTPARANAALNFGSVHNWLDLFRRDNASVPTTTPNLLATPVFLGWSTLVFALLGLFSTRQTIAPWLRDALLVAGVVAFALALGPAGGALPSTVWAFTLQAFPALSAMLFPSHLVFVTTLVVCVLAGLGIHRSLGVLPGQRSLALVALPLFFLSAWDLHLVAGGRHVETVARPPLAPRIYSALSQRPAGAVLELPFANCRLDTDIARARSMYNSTYHWRPILNGFGKLEQVGKTEIEALITTLPDPRALELLARIADLRHIVIETSPFPVSERNRWIDLGNTTEIDYRDGRLLLEVASNGARDLAEPFRRLRSLDVTLMGTPVRALPSSGRRMEASAQFVYDASAPGIPTSVEAVVSNVSDRPWPVLGGPNESRVRVVYRWERPNGQPVPGTKPEYRANLPFDLAPGDTVAFELCVSPPMVTGEVHLVLGLAQGMDWFAGTPARAPLELRAFEPEAS